MGFLDFYKWVLPDQAAHLNGYRDNEQLYNMALAFWDDLNSASIWFLILFIALGLILVCFYYYGYNKWPGRKYKVWQWAVWIAVTYFITMIATDAIGSTIVTTTLKEKSGFLLRISLVNGLYSMIVYFIASLIICNIPVPTNAYRFLKIVK
mgnify:CR=1 FL=1